jgi:hypothetical protein
MNSAGFMVGSSIRRVFAYSAITIGL